MSVKAAETAAPFSEASCQALSALVLRTSGLSYRPAGCEVAVSDDTVPEDLVEGLRELAATDPAVAQWGKRVMQHLVAKQRVTDVAETSGEPAINVETLGEFRHQQPRADYGRSNDDGWTLIAARLPQLIILHGPPPTADTNNAAWSQLQAACHVVLRLRTLENRFAGELQRQKREAIYQFAYGLSHELNNPLANIATRGGVLAEQESHPQRKILLEAIVNNAMRGCEMLGDLMLVARPPQLNLKSARIDSVVISVVDSAQRWAGNLKVDLKLDVQTTREILIDAEALREALWALIRNGLEAMFDGGAITVSVTDCELLGCEPVGVCIEISDQGSGLSRAALEHCFDPYYSGREAGRGLGLGLSKAQRIVELHHGKITLANRPGGGVVARVMLPTG